MYSQSVQGMTPKRLATFLYRAKRLAEKVSSEMTYFELNLNLLNKQQNFQLRPLTCYTMPN